LSCWSPYAGQVWAIEVELIGIGIEVPEVNADVVVDDLVVGHDDVRDQRVTATPEEQAGGVVWFGRVVLLDDLVNRHILPHFGTGRAAEPIWGTGTTGRSAE
jgi:hypothetical protein